MAGGAACASEQVRCASFRAQTAESSGIRLFAKLAVSADLTRVQTNPLRKEIIVSNLANNTKATVIPCLRYRNAQAAIEWLRRAFGFEKHLVVPGEGELSPMPS
jgi:hypothetical protein